MAKDPLKTLTEVLDFMGLDMIDAQGHKVQQPTEIFFRNGSNFSFISRSLIVLVFFLSCRKTRKGNIDGEGVVLTVFGLILGLFTIGLRDSNCSNGRRVKGDDENWCSSYKARSCAARTHESILPVPVCADATPAPTPAHGRLITPQVVVVWLLPLISGTPLERGPKE